MNTSPIGFKLIRASANGVQVTITCSTVGATIYYTTDGTDPSAENGTQYSEPFQLLGNATVKAIAIKEGLLDSQIATASVEVTLPTPTLEKQAGTASDNCKVIISNITDFASFANVKFYYTTDGNIPTEESTKTTGEIAIDKNCTVKVKAFYEAGEESVVASIEISDLQVQMPVIDAEE